MAQGWGEGLGFLIIIEETQWFMKIYFKAGLHGKIEK